MNKKQYKLGFIGGGLGSIAGSPHYIASRMDKRFEVVAGVFSSNAECNQQTADARQLTAYNTIDEMLDNEKLDAVVVLTPTPLHYENIKLLIDRKIFVICEKPLVASIEEAESLIQEKGDRFVVVTNNYSGYPMIRELKALIAEGTLGDIINMRLQMPQETFLRPPKNIKYPQPWRLKDGFIPMICLDLGVHLHHLMYFLSGKEPQKVMAEFNSFSKYDVIDDVNIWMEFNDLSKASMWMSKSALGHRNGLAVDVYGDKGTASWVQMTPEVLNLSFSDGSKTIIDRGGDCKIANQARYSRMTSGHPSGFIEAFANLYSDIADAVDEYKSAGTCNNQYVFGMDHAFNGLKIFHQARLAHEDGTWQKLNNEA